MDTKHIHCMLEKMSEYGKEMIEAGAGAGNVNLDDAGKIVDMVKDLACAEKDALIAKEMRKAHEEDESEEKYFLKMLKEEKQDEYKKMKEEYGEDEGERRFYDRYRYKNGRFAPKGRGTRRSYVEPPYYHVMPDMYEDYNAEYLRDMDRDTHKRLYYTESAPDSANMSRSANMDNMRSDNRMESRYDKMKRGYQETKEMHKGSSQEDTAENMKGLEKLLNVIDGDLKELMPDMTPSEKSMAKQKLTAWAQRIQ